MVTILPALRSNERSTHYQNIFARHSINKSRDIISVYYLYLSQFYPLLSSSSNCFKTIIAVNMHNNLASPFLPTSSFSSKGVLFVISICSLEPHPTPRRRPHSHHLCIRGIRCRRSCARANRTRGALDLQRVQEAASADDAVDGRGLDDCRRSALAAVVGGAAADGAAGGLKAGGLDTC